MKVEIRVYKLFDTDLVALADSGYPLTEMMKTAIISYANGTPLFYCIDELIPFNMNGKKNVRLRFVIPESETKATYLLKNIKHGYRNTFCKMILRNTFVQQNMSCFFYDNNLIQLQNMRSSYINYAAFTNMVMASTIRNKERQIQITPGTTINIAMPQAQSFISPFPTMQMPPASEYVPIKQSDHAQDRTKNKPKHDHQETESKPVSFEQNTQKTPIDSDDAIMEAFDAL